MALVLWIYCNRNEIEWGKKRLFMGRTGEKNMVWSGPFVGISAKRKLIPIFTGEVMDVLGNRDLRGGDGNVNDFFGVGTGSVTSEENGNRIAMGRIMDYGRLADWCHLG